MKQLSVKTKIMALIVFCILASNLYLGYLDYRDSETLAIDIIKKNNEKELTNIREYYFDKMISDVEYIVNRWAASPEIVEYNKPEGTEKIVSRIPADFDSVYKEWLGLTKSLRNVAWVYYALESDGSIYIAPLDESMPSDYDARVRDWYIGTVNQAGKIYWTEPYLDAGASGKILQTVSKAVYKDGQLKGVIGVDIELNRFTEIIDNLSFAKSSSIFLLNQNNEIIAHNSDSNSTSYQAILRDIRQKRSTEIIDYHNRKYVVSWTPLSINNWKLIAITETSFEGDLISMKIRIMLVVICISLFSVYLGHVGAKNALKPLLELIKVTESVAKGNLSIRSTASSTDEFTRLSDSFNRMLDQIDDLMKERDQNYIKTVRSLANAIEASDEYTRGHCDRVGFISKKIMDVLDFPENKRAHLEIACILHDIGKIGVPDSILNKPEKLTDEEYECIKRHPLIGHDMIKEVEFLKEPAEILLQHHERLDGKGYPFHLTDHQIRIESKILAVADTYDAMSSFRIYRPDVMTKEDIIRELLSSAGTQLDAKIVDILVNLIREDALDIT